MAIPVAGIWEFHATGTANMVNGGGFNPANANFLTDLTVDTNTGNTASPVVSSASYTFVSGDVGAWLFVKSGTNWTAGFYPIVSVAGGKATVNATIGSAVAYDSTNKISKPSTVTGVATVGTPTGGTFGINYSQLDNAAFALTGVTSAGAGAIALTASASVIMAGNFVKVVSGTNFTVGWYEIVSAVAGVSITTDRNCCSGVGAIGVLNVGGALSLNSTLDDDFFEIAVGGNRCQFKYGSYTLGESVSIASASATTTAMIHINGYYQVWGDKPIKANAPTIAMGALSFATGTCKQSSYINWTTTSAVGLALSTTCMANRLTVLNSSSTADRVALSNGGSSVTMGCDLVSQNGMALSLGAISDSLVYGNSIHDSDTGVSHSGATTEYVENVFYTNETDAVYINSSSLNRFHNNTFVGSKIGSTRYGNGVTFQAGSVGTNFFNNIFTRLVNGITATVLHDFDFSFNNNFYDCGTDETLYKTRDALALDPGFLAFTQITGTTGNTSGSTLTQSDGDFSTIEDNVDFLHIVSGTGVTVACYLITSHTATTVVCNNALGTSNSNNVNYYITTARNFAIGVNLKDQALFSTINPSTTNYKDLGAVQRRGPQQISYASVS